MMGNRSSSKRVRKGSWFQKGWALFLTIAVLAGGAGLPAAHANAEEPPAVIRSSWHAEPGQALELNGGYFGTMGLRGETATKVVLQPLSAAAGPLAPEAATMQLPLVNVQDNVIQALIPATASKDLYAAWVKTAAGFSDPVFVNRAEPFRLSERIVYPGQEVHVFGRNFLSPVDGTSAGVRLELVDAADNSRLPVNPVHVTDYTIDIAVPDGARPGGTYTVRMTNGAGGEYGWVQLSTAFRVTEANANVRFFRDELGLQAAWLGDVPVSRRLDATSFHAQGDGTTDDTAAIQAALNAAGQQGGGIVFLPAGTYLINELNIPGKTVLLGEGKERTILRYAGGKVPADQNKPGWIYGESIYLIHSTGDSVGIANLAIESDARRPDNDAMRRLGGWVDAVALGFEPTYKTGDPFLYNHRGYFVKNVRIRMADGMGVQTLAISDVIVEDSDIQVTHGAVHNYVKEAEIRVRNNTMSNSQRPLIAGGNAAWIEGNDLSAVNCSRRTDIKCEPPQNAGTQEHRIMDLSPDNNYIANNTVTGQFGSNAPSNDGEGILWQGNQRGAYAMASAADATGLTDNSQSFVANSLQGMKIIIVGGKGIGQMRMVTANTDHRIAIDQPWQVVPDQTSVYTVDKAVNYHNIVTGNHITAKTKKGGIVLYTKNYDNIVTNNTLQNTGGIWLTEIQNASQKRADFSYFAYAANNSVSGASDPDGHMPNHVTIGSAGDGGVYTPLDLALPSTGVYGSEFRNNTITGIGTDASALYTSNKGNKNWVDGSGLMVSTKASIDYPIAQGVIVEGNRVTNTIAGVHLSNTSYDTLLRNNDFGGNGVDVDNINSVRTVRVNDEHVLPASPERVSAVIGTDGAATIVWDPAAYADSYTVKRADSLAGPYTTLAAGLTRTSYRDETVGGQSYTYEVTAHNDYGDSYANRVTSGLTMKKAGSVDTPGRAFSVAASTYYAYVADNDAGLHIIDVSDPASPRIVSTLDTPGNAVRVQVQGNYAYVADQAGGLQIIDISDPGRPLLVKRVVTTYAKGVFVSGNYAYVADSTTGLRIVDISNPASAVIKGTVSTGNAASVYVRGNYAYLVNGSSGLKIVDVSNPAKPVVVGAVALPGNAQDIVLSGNYAYVADGTTDKLNGVEIIDVSDPANPLLAGRFNTNGDPASVYVQGNWLYVGDYFNNLNLYTIVDPLHPKLAGQLATTSNVFGIAASGDYVYLANSFDGLTVVNTSMAPAAPHTTATVSPAQADGGNGWYVNPVTVTLTATGRQSGVAKTEISLDYGHTWQLYTAPITLDQDGKIILSYKSTDQAGHAETPRYVYINLDATAPVTNATVAPAEADGQNGWYVNQVAVTLGAADRLSGVATTEYSLDNGNTWQFYANPLLFDHDGHYVVSYRSTDNAGNVEATKTADIRIDRTTPTAAIAYSSTTPTFDRVVATITPSEAVTITNNGGANSYTFLFNGSFTFEFVDAAGHTGAATATVTNIVYKSAGLPGKPVLSDDNGYDTGLLDGNYNVKMNIWWGNNGRIYKLYENDVLLDTQLLTDNSPNAQSTVTSVTYRKNGNYRYYAELTNAFGTTRSDVLTVTVTQAAPAKPVLAHDNWDGDGQYNVSMNMWWGTNGTTYRLYENGVLIDMQALADASPHAQAAVTAIRDKPAGTYEYRGELVNDAGATSSDVMMVTVSK